MAEVEVLERCSRCGVELSGAGFAVDRSKARGRKSWCKACDNARGRGYYERNREERLAKANARNRAAAAQRPARLCARCGNPATSQKHRYCNVCRALVAKPPQRRSWRDRNLPRAARGYGTAHQALRQKWKKVVDRGGVTCARCGLPILPGSRWDLDHTEDRSGYAGPAHSSCNRSAGGRNGGFARHRRKTSREW